MYQPQPPPPPPPGAPHAHSMHHLARESIHHKLQTAAGGRKTLHIGDADADDDGPAAPTISRQTLHSKELIDAFKPIKYFLTIIGQMPFTIKPKKDGTYSFKFYKVSVAAIVYFIMFFISSALYLAVTIGILSFVLDSVFQYITPDYYIIVQDRETKLTEMMLWERYLIRHEMVSMIVVWSWLTVACAGSLYIVTNSKYYVHYMNYFNRVVQIMDMDMTPGVGNYIFVNNLLSCIVALLLIAGLIAGFVAKFNAVTNTALVIFNFILRLVNVELEDFSPQSETIYKIGGFIIMIYSLFAARANVIQFLFFSQLLKNGSKIWNERLRKVLNHSPVDPADADNQFNRRLEPRLIYKDHLMIVQLYQMTENVFGTILFAYYSLTLISIVMELYQLAALQGFGAALIKETAATLNSTQIQSAADLKKLYDSRQSTGDDAEDEEHHQEIIAVAGVSVLLLFQNLLFCYRTTVDAAKAYEDAMEGFDILRRHGLMFCKNRTDRNFVLSLYFSFAKNNPLQLTAGGYFAVNKVLLVTLVSAVVNWAISIYQTKVDQWR